MQYVNMTKEQLKLELDKYNAEMNALKEKGLKLDLSRGKPSKEQLDLSMPMLNVINSRSVMDSENGVDCRNYGGLDGIPEAKRLLADMLSTRSENVLVSDNSSLSLMFSLVSHGMLEGIMGETPWYEVKNRKFLCPVPGYDRHFAITEHFGFELISVPMNEEGPDMDVVERLVSSDESIKGIWCVPMYSNPTGIVFSDETVKRFAHLKPKAKDFRIFWDNAYCVHGLYPDDNVKFPDILEECAKAGNADMVYEFCSTSKISFPGDGISALATSVANLIDVKNFMKFSTIGPDKLTQLRHARYFKNLAGIKAHMAKHADIMRPKFEKVLEILARELEGTGIASWTKPRGGYFLSFDTMNGCAAKVVALCKEAGVVFTGAGATHPYGVDPEDKNIRIAPSFATLDEIDTAASLFCLAVKIVSLEKLIAE